MAGKRISMRKTREIIRLSVAGLSARAVARACRTSPTTAGDTIRAARGADLHRWPLPELGDGALRERLFGPRSGGRTQPPPDFEGIDRRMRVKHTTLRLLWEEYSAAHPDGYAYSRFCELYAEWRGTRGAEAVMRFEHRAGETLFVDWAGATVRYLENGVEREAAVFVGVLGASDYIFANAYRDMTQDNWLQAHIDAFERIGGVTEKVVPDNPRTAVSRACNYDPELNPAYRELAEHYAVAILPARPGKPRDKAKAENGVRNVGQRVIARLRNMQLLSFGQLQSAVRRLTDELNDRPFSKREGCRRSLFEQIERPVLKPLPTQAFSRGEWRKATVFKDYHIELDGFYYSVPARHIGARVEVRLTGKALEVYHDGVRIALHPRTPPGGKRASTLAEHMPPEHRAIVDRTAGDFLEKAARCGPNCRQVAAAILGSFPRPEMGFRSCQGLLRLAQRHGHRRTECACMRSIEVGSPRYRTVSNMLANGMEQETAQPERAPIRHGNVRGSGYYAAKGERS